MKRLWCKKGFSEKLNLCQGRYLKKEENATQNWNNGLKCVSTSIIFNKLN